jgi:hypothetical protein
MSQKRLHARNFPYIKIPKFGLDVGFYICGPSGKTARFLEFKCFCGGRPGGVGFGDGKRGGLQTTLLHHSVNELAIVEPLIRWVLVDALLPLGAKRYAIFDSITAKAAAMGGQIAVGKQNNFRLSALQPQMTVWNAFVDKLETFLVP